MSRQVKYPELSQLSPKSKDAAYKRLWLEETKPEPYKMENYRKKQNEYKRCLHAKLLALKLQQSNVDSEPPEKRRRVISPDTGPSDSNMPASNSPTVIASPLHGKYNSPDNMTLPGLSDVIIDHTPVQALPSCQFSDISITTERPPLTHDVNVMTKISSICPSTSLNDDPAPSTPLTPLSDLPYHSKDLTTNILGVQVSSFSDTVQWSGGFTTVLPCIWKGEENLCQADANMVQYFSQLPESDPESLKHVVHVHQHSWYFNPEALCDLVAETLHEGKCIVIRAAQKPQPAKLDVDYLEALSFSQYKC
ncbi:hypothetical protein BDR07DRAFT_1488506 [Suillus spraguei]|nr:hypothetical protein BDR07DRAFT_1488506 [Suillus spraguei]